MTKRKRKQKNVPPAPPAKCVRLQDGLPRDAATGRPRLDLLRKADLLQLAEDMQRLLGEAIGFAGSRQAVGASTPPAVTVGWLAQAEHLAGGPVQRALCIEHVNRELSSSRGAADCTRDMFPD